jgi:hypothetical protein
MLHKLHLAVANTLDHLFTGTSHELLKDPACGGEQYLPLFIREFKSLANRICCVDLLVLQTGKVRAIIEIEESGFLPTKPCGKFLQAVLATHFIHESHGNTVIPYAEKVLFVQVFDGSTFNKDKTQKKVQAELIEKEIQKKLPLGGISDYRLFVIDGPDDQKGFATLCQVINALIPDLAKQKRTA